MNQQLDRVSDTIGPVVCEFMVENLNQEFHAADLLAYVTAKVGYVAPSSPTRIMQHLKKMGEINYELISRPKSMYISRGLVSRWDNVN